VRVVGVCSCHSLGFQLRRLTGDALLLSAVLSELLC
jgi:hypothetical protein